jgi:hypothetical protein
MITTFLWMLYLAFTLFITIGFVYNNILLLKNKIDGKETVIYDILVCFLWSIWYFYYLN